MDLLSSLQDIFRSRGYRVLTTSPENRYLLLQKDDSTLAVGYSDVGRSATEGEAEMFASMAENDGSDSMLFISSVRLEKGVRKVLERTGAATWDRMALAIAIGEETLGKVEVEGPPITLPNPSSTKEKGPERILDLFQKDDVDPLGELREFAKDEEEKEVGGFRVQEIDLKSPVPQEGGASVEPSCPPVEVSAAPSTRSNVKEPSKMTAPPEMPKVDIEIEADGGGAKVDVAVPQVDAWAGFSEWLDNAKTEAPEGRAVTVEGAEIPLVPWAGAIVAPILLSREDACAKAGASADTDPDLVHIPYILLEVDYDLRAEDGESVKRHGSYLYDAVEGEVVDIPDSIGAELLSTSEVWKGEGILLSAEEQDEKVGKHIRSIKKRLSREGHSVDKLIRETLMSTIYEEIRYLFDPSTFNILSQRKVVLPAWRLTDGTGKTTWTVDAFLGRFNKK